MKNLRTLKAKYFLMFVILLFQTIPCSGVSDKESNQNERDNISSAVPSKEKKVEESNDKEHLFSNGNVKPVHEDIDENPKILSDNSKNNITSKNYNAKSLLSDSASASNQQPRISGPHIPSINSGALIRSIYVIIGLSVLVMAYIVFRSFRLHKPRAQMVRKYGVLAHRQDVEMRPLPLDVPLDEDDEDDTIFDASDVAVHMKNEI